MVPGQQKRGRPPRSRDRAVRWLVKQPWFADWRDAPTYRDDRDRWRIIANVVRERGFYSKTTGTIDVPVECIVTQAIEIRDSAAA